MGSMWLVYIYLHTCHQKISKASNISIHVGKYTVLTWILWVATYFWITCLWICGWIGFRQTPIQNPSQPLEGSIRDWLLRWDLGIRGTSNLEKKQLQKSSHFPILRKLPLSPNPSKTSLGVDFFKLQEGWVFVYPGKKWSQQQGEKLATTLSNVATLV